jgi:hypothetical protein
MTTLILQSDINYASISAWKASLRRNFDVAVALADIHGGVKRVHETRARPA